MYVFYKVLELDVYLFLVIVQEVSKSIYMILMIDDDDDIDNDSEYCNVLI